MKISIKNALLIAGIGSAIGITSGMSSPAAAYAPLLSHAHTQKHWEAGPPRLVPGGSHLAPGPQVWIPERRDFNPFTGDFEVHPGHFEQGAPVLVPDPPILVPGPPVWVPDTVIFPYGS